jgi:hypothetical protein
VGETQERSAVPFDILLFLAIVVITSAVLLSLLHFGILTLQDRADADLLNTEFIPFERDGTMIISKFEFCSEVDSTYTCINPKDVFRFGEQIHFRVLVRSDPVNSIIRLEENYRIIGPQSQIFLEVGDRDAFLFEKAAEGDAELVAIADSFTIDSTLPTREYTLELFIENPLLNKKTTISRTFTVTS